MLFHHFSGFEAFAVDPSEDVVESLRSGNDVEGRGHGATFFKIRNPKFAPCKFPFCVSFFLHFFFFRKSIFTFNNSTYQICFFQLKRFKDQGSEDRIS